MTKPNLPGAGGSYARDPETGELTRTEGTIAQDAEPAPKPKRTASKKKEG
jgi:hypothetical protein